MAFQTVGVTPDVSASRADVDVVKISAPKGADIAVLDALLGSLRTMGSQIELVDFCSDLQTPIGVYFWMESEVQAYQIHLACVCALSNGFAWRLMGFFPPSGENSYGCPTRKPGDFRYLISLTKHGSIVDRLKHSLGLVRPNYHLEIQALISAMTDVTKSSDSFAKEMWTLGFAMKQLKHT